MRRGGRGGEGGGKGREGKGRGEDLWLSFSLENQEETRRK
jgi:hypothetical protein